MLREDKKFFDRRVAKAARIHARFARRLARNSRAWAPPQTWPSLKDNRREKFCTLSALARDRRVLDSFSTQHKVLLTKRVSLCVLYILLQTSNYVNYSYSVNRHTWIPIRMPFLGRRKPVDIKAFRKAVWAVAPKQATYKETSCALGLGLEGLQNHIVFNPFNPRVKPWVNKSGCNF